MVTSMALGSGGRRGSSRASGAGAFLINATPPPPPSPPAKDGIHFTFALQKVRVTDLMDPRSGSLFLFGGFQNLLRGLLAFLRFQVFTPESLEPLPGGASALKRHHILYWLLKSIFTRSFVCLLQLALVRFLHFGTLRPLFHLAYKLGIK